MFFVSADNFLTCFLCTVLNFKKFFQGFSNNSAFYRVKFTVFSPNFLFVILHIAAKFRICVFFRILILYQYQNRKFNQIESTTKRSAGTYKNSAASAGEKRISPQDHRPLSYENRRIPHGKERNYPYHHRHSRSPDRENGCNERSTEDLCYLHTGAG